MRLTEPRKALLIILEQADRPLSAEEILASSGDNRALDLVTIYRNMTAFCELGIVQTVKLENGKQLFELQRHEDDHHHHIVCRKCHSVVRLDLCFGGELEKYAQSQGFSELTHTIEVFGVCEDCKN